MCLSYIHSNTVMIWKYNHQPVGNNPKLLDTLLNCLISLFEVFQGPLRKGRKTVYLCLYIYTCAPIPLNVMHYMFVSAHNIA